MIRKNITIKLPSGLEARPVANFIQVANQYDSTIDVEYRDKKVSGKSMMGMMNLGIAQGETVTVIVNGPDEEEAIKGLEANLTNKE